MRQALRLLARARPVAAFAMPLYCLLAISIAPQIAFAANADNAQPSDEDAPIYCLDPVHTRVMLAVEHAGFSKAIGTLSGSTGELRFDADDWAQAKIEVSIPIARLDFGDEKWNKAVLAGSLLDAARYPAATFVSDRIEIIGENRATVHGTLRLHGSAQPIALDVVMNAMKRHPLPPFRRTVGFSGRAALSRKAFGIDAWPSVIGDDVELRIEAEATRGQCDGKPTEASQN
jgi:polyisoprenoid-binding protein YceI